MAGKQVEVRMPYVRRNARGEIESVHRASSPDALEYLDPADQEVTDFLAQPADSRSAIGPELSIVLSDAFDVLLKKRVLSIDELSREAQAAWLLLKEIKAREEKRRFVASGFVEIIDDSTFGVLGGAEPEPRQT